MSDEMQIEGKSYISSKRASDLSGYAQDYIGQLARKSLIDARRIGGLWYVSMESLDAYKRKADEFKPLPPVRTDTAEPGRLILFDGKEYLSAARAAELTGYAQDYVGQLARSGTILSHQVGNRWYVERQGLLRHKKEKDGLLAAVQADSVGLSRAKSAPMGRPEHQSNISYSGSGPVLNYYTDGGDLMPSMNDRSEHEAVPTFKESDSENMIQRPVPIRRIGNELSLVRRRPGDRYSAAESARIARRSLTPILLGAAATIIIVLSVGYASLLRQNSAYATNLRLAPDLGALPASADAAFSKIGDLLEPLLTHELNYVQQSTN